ncbi:MAG: alpha/beta hydrolase, partial [Chloroflexi bacterium]|nr:alpha/beta hydrolase [Chloroflexota bacterium]
IPTQIVWGEEDAFLDKRMASLSLEYCRNGRLTMLPGVTHWVQHEAANQVNALLIEHFAVEGVLEEI